MLKAKLLKQAYLTELKWDDQLPEAIIDELWYPIPICEDWIQNTIDN